MEDNYLRNVLLKLAIGIPLGALLMSFGGQESHHLVYFLLGISMFTWVPYIAIFPGFFIRYVHNRENWYWKEIGKPPRLSLINI